MNTHTHIFTHNLSKSGDENWLWVFRYTYYHHKYLYKTNKMLKKKNQRRLNKIYFKNMADT